MKETTWGVTTSNCFWLAVTRTLWPSHWWGSGVCALALWSSVETCARPFLLWLSYTLQQLYSHFCVENMHFSFFSMCWWWCEEDRYSVEPVRRAQSTWSRTELSVLRRDKSVLRAQCTTWLFKVHDTQHVRSPVSPQLLSYVTSAQKGLLVGFVHSELIEITPSDTSVSLKHWNAVFECAAVMRIIDN